MPQFFQGLERCLAFRKVQLTLGQHGLKPRRFTYDHIFFQLACSVQLTNTVSLTFAAETHIVQVSTDLTRILHSCELGLKDSEHLCPCEPPFRLASWGPKGHDS